jgi:cytochrome c peroxidase
MAARGRARFNGRAECANCHVPPTYTDVASRLHDAADNCTDGAYAARGTTGQYRTTPLRALWQHPPYFHDGRFATLQAVVEHYDGCRTLNLTPAEKADLVEFLKSL